MKKKWKVSVIIPVYNPGHHLNKCLDSILNQTYDNLEIILVDDGSSDGSEKICDSYKEKDLRIKVIHQRNSGVSKARNVGLELATGDFYHFPDSDDYLEPDTYELCIHLINKHCCDAVVFEHFVTYENHEERHNSPNEYYGLYEGKNEIIKIYFRTAYACNKFFGKQLIASSADVPAIRFREDIFRGEDGIFSMEALFKADRVWYTDRAFYHYVQSEESACRGVFRPSQLSLLKAIDVTKDFFSDNYPEYLQRLEISELGSCITLYSDMYLDDADYTKECKEVYERFQKLYKAVDWGSIRMKEKIKFMTFNINPALYCKIHKYNTKRLKK